MFPTLCAEAIFQHNPYDNHQNFIGVRLHTTWSTKVKHGYPTTMKMDGKW